MHTLAGILAALAIAPGHAEIAFESDGRIWSSRADGSERQLLVAPTARGETLSEPAWSPDGTQLAYVRAGGEDARHIMLLDAAGARAITPLREGVADDSPAWSPDGTALAFARFTATGQRFRTRIVTRAVASGVERVIVSVPLFPRFESVVDPSWSPDGATIAYTHSSLDRRHYFRHSVRAIPATGGYSTLLLREALSAVWSPDGRRLAFTSIRDRNGSDCGSDECIYAGELYTAAADGSGLTRLTRNEGYDGVPAWSPDGSRILFSSDRNLPGSDSSEVYSVAADGSCLTWLTNGTPASSEATWRPGSGSQFDPGSCDPGTRVARIDSPPPAPLRDRLWLGTRYRGLLLSGVDHRSLAYADCERFDPRRCPPTVDLRTEAACRFRAFRGFTENAYRMVRRRGALVGSSEEGGGVTLVSGHAVTTVFAYRGGARRVMDDLRALDAARPARRLAPPRVPRVLARRLEATARAYAREHSVEGTARALGVARHRVKGRLRLRAALRSFGPYRFSACDSGGASAGSGGGERQLRRR